MRVEAEAQKKERQRIAAQKADQIAAADKAFDDAAEKERLEAGKIAADKAETNAQEVVPAPTNTTDADGSLGGGIIAAIVITSILAIVIAYVIVSKYCLNKEDDDMSTDSEQEGLDSEIGVNDEEMQPSKNRHIDT